MSANGELIGSMSVQNSNQKMWKDQKRIEGRRFDALLQSPSDHVSGWRVLNLQTFSVLLCC